MRKKATTAGNDGKTTTLSYDGVPLGYEVGLEDSVLPADPPISSAPSFPRSLLPSFPRSVPPSPLRPAPSSILALSPRGILALATVAVGAYSVFVEPRWLEITQVEVPLPRLPRRLDGLRIAHLSDFHASSLVSDEWLGRCIRAATDAEPDLVLLTGDFVTSSQRHIPGLHPLLAGLRARYGVVSVLGNHDHTVFADGVAATVESAGVRVLRNTHERLEIGNATLWLVGIDSMRGKQYRLRPREQAAVDGRMRRYLSQALNGVDPAGFSLLLAHSPDILPMARAAGIDMVLCGHTHGGQVRLPFIGATIVPSRFGPRYAAGLYREGDTCLYVNRGVGVVRLPVRFLCRPELSILTLRRA